MSVKPIIPSISSNNNANNLKIRQNNIAKNNNVSFGGTNLIVDTMDFIGKGGFAAAFCIQDGIGFIFPRVYEGLTRGSKKKDENGNPVLDENGKQVREYNWALARKELLRELITGPSAFIIPWLGLKGISKFAPANNVKLNYINGFNNAFTDFAKANLNEIKSGNPSKVGFYQNVFEEVLEKTFNKPLPVTKKLTSDEVKSIAQEYAQRQVKIEEILADKSLNKAQRAEKIAEIGGSVENSFMKLKKGKIGGAVDELAITMKSTDGSLKHGSIGELLSSMGSYFDDAMKNTKKALTNNPNANIADVITSFTNRRMGTRILTNLGLFGLVAAFYTQIPKIYNSGQKGNPGLKGTAADPSLVGGAQSQKDTPEETKVKSNQPSFGGLGSLMEKTGNAVFNNKAAKSISDIFELNGPVISGMAMPVLLYGFCIPPRLSHAQDKYDYGEVILRDMTSFTTLLFGAKALSRMFSDWFTKHTGLALNSKNLEGRNVFQKVIDYLNPSDGRHSVLSSKQLDSKYTNLEDYKGGVNGFVEFIENSGGNIKKAFTRDENVQACVDKIVKDVSGKSFAEASVAEIKEALKTAHNSESKLIKEFYELFKGQNGLLKAAKTCNSTFNFISTFAITPGIIIALTQACKRMTERRTAADLAAKDEKNVQEKQNLNVVVSKAPTMAGFLKK